MFQLEAVPRNTRIAVTRDASRTGIRGARDMAHGSDRIGCPRYFIFALGGKQYILIQSRPFLELSNSQVRLLGG